MAAGPGGAGAPERTRWARTVCPGRGSCRRTASGLRPGTDRPMLTGVMDETPTSRRPCTLERIASGPAQAAGGIVAFVLLLTMPGVSTWAQPPAHGPATTEAAMPSEWEIFVKHGCARCHRVRGMGDGAGGPDLAHLGSRTGFFEIGAAMWNHLPRMRQ